MSITLRPATLADAERLRNWRNEASTLQASSDSTPVSTEDHERWLVARLGERDTGLWIAEEFNKPVGQVRLEVLEGEATVSVSVSEAARGRGLGVAVIAALQEMASAEPRYLPLFAVVKSNNSVSRRLFERCGFELASSEGEFLKYKWDPLKSAGEG